MKKLLCTAFAALLGATPAFAQNAVDVGVIKNDDVKIVQKLLYPKVGRLEYGAHLGVMPFDAYTLTPTFAATIAKHFREDMGVEGTFMGGYGFKSSTYKELESPPTAWRRMPTASSGASWQTFSGLPIYAKMNVAGQRIYHHDVFFTAGLGGTLERAIQPDASTTVSPDIRCQHRLPRLHRKGPRCSCAASRRLAHPEAREDGGHPEHLPQAKRHAAHRRQQAGW